jgi:hypothetical protein
VRSEAGRGVWVVMFVSLVLLGERTGSTLGASLGVVSNFEHMIVMALERPTPQQSRPSTRRRHHGGATLPRTPSRSE